MHCKRVRCRAVYACSEPGQQQAHTHTCRQRDRQTDRYCTPACACKRNSGAATATSTEAPHYARQLGRHGGKADGPGGRTAVGGECGVVASTESQPTAQRERERESTALIADQASCSCPYTAHCLTSTAGWRTQSVQSSTLAVHQAAVH